MHVHVHRCGCEAPSADSRLLKSNKAGPSNQSWSWCVDGEELTCTLESALLLLLLGTFANSWLLCCDLATHHLTVCPHRWQRHLSPPVAPNARMEWFARHKHTLGNARWTVPRLLLLGSVIGVVDCGARFALWFALTKGARVPLGLQVGVNVFTTVVAGTYFGIVIFCWQRMPVFYDNVWSVPCVALRSVCQHFGLLLEF